MNNDGMKRRVDTFFRLVPTIISFPIPYKKLVDERVIK